MNNKKQLENRLNILKDKCIDNFDYNFSKYLLIDLKETRKVEGLYYELDHYLYWFECAEEIIKIIDTLLEIETVWADDLNIKAINIKRVIDKELINTGQKDLPEIYKELKLDYWGSKYGGKIIPLKFEGDDKLRFVMKFHDCLVMRNWIKSDLESFKSNFFESDVIIPINWMYYQNVLILIIKSLSEKGYIGEIIRTPSQLISQHFIWKGKKIPEKNVSTTHAFNPDDNLIVKAFMEELLG